MSRTAVAGQPGRLPRLVGVFLLYLSVVFVGAALVSPWLWRLIHDVLPSSPLVRQPFHRYINRSLIVFALAGLWPLHRFGFFPDLRGAGWIRRPSLVRELACGFLLGLGTLALIVVAACCAGVRTWNEAVTGPIVVQHVFKAAGAALLVSLMEELLFRGGIFGGLRRAGGFRLAAAVSSVIYALVHFFQRPAPPDFVDAFTGFQMLARMSVGFLDLSAMVPGFFNLALAGLILSAVRERTGALWVSIGLHAGWIFWLKSYAYFTRPLDGATNAFWGSSKLIDGWIALPVLLLAALAIRGFRACGIPSEIQDRTARTACERP